MGTAGSGFGWNDKDKIIVVEQQIFNEWKSSHPNANGLYNKLFRYFEELGIAFSRDSAQGGNAENVTQAVATMEAEREATLSDRQEPPTPSVPAAPGASAAPSASAALSFSSIEKNKRKRGSKSKEVIDIVTESMRNMKGTYQEHTAILVDMVSCFKNEKEGAERRMKLMTLLRDVPSLSIDDRMKAGLSIVRNNSLIDMVFQLQPEELLSFLKKLI
ncbi:Myb/SANT-like DNA-binding domain protein [Arachis hypogaea]|nr:Myb/SANT-like DNA-binding domain protein [Arachis hypogaea]